MSHWNTMYKTFFWFILCLTLSLVPLTAHALDLYLDQMEVTGGNDYVIKGNTPADKYYTGVIVCSKGSLEKLPKSTILTTTLRRAGTIEVRTDVHTYASTDWLYNSTSGLYYILLRTGSYPRVSDYSFDMPVSGSGTSELRTGTYSFKYAVTSGVTESNIKNNTVYGSSFAYTVFSGNLSYDSAVRTITSLTPATLAMCSGDTYLSAVSGDWDATWWNTNFSMSGLCADSSSNSDGYSTDLTVIREVSLASPPVLEGQRWSLKGQSPGNLSLNGLRVECAGSPPGTLRIDTSLQSSVIQPDYEIAHYSEEITPVWLEDTANSLYYFELGRIYYALPGDGPTLDDLQTGSHAFVSTITALGDTTTADNQGDTGFSYTVYSGLLYFNDVETTFSSISFGPAFSCWDGTQFHLNLSSVSGSWNDAFGVEPLNGADLCADSLGNPDGYSRDLKLFSGEVDFNTLSGTISGLAIDFNQTVLDETGGSFSSAVVTLPEDITYHTENGGSISPLGLSYLTFSGRTFIQSIEELTLVAPAAPYLHSYGLPFYIRSDAFRFPLNGSTGMELVNPYPVYVHAEAVAALAPTDPRSSFPSNDILFQAPLSAANAVTFDQHGLDGHLDFRSGTLWALQTSYPRARLAFNNWRLILQDGKISTDTSIPGLGVAMRFGRGCHDAECADAEAGSRWYQVHADKVSMTENGDFGAQFIDLGATLDEKLYDTGEDSVAWGDFQVDVPGTYVRQDRGRYGAFVVPGFIMQKTNDKLSSPLRLGQVLLGSYLFKDVNQLNGFSPLHDLESPLATQGDGMFAGFNLGPENYTNLKEGIGQFLERETLIRFYDADGLNPQIRMKDKQAVKYVLRPGGLTGVFNTSFNSDSDGMINIYDYDIAFKRFSFRQDRNTLDGETFIDGGLTLSSGPVANGAQGQQQDFSVGFTNLDLTCNGNLGSGMVDTEPEPNWPECDGINGDGDGLTDEGCQTLVYWNMPVLLTGMAFETVPGSAGNTTCPAEDRQLRIHTYNQIDALGQPLTMSALYSPEGVLGYQELYGTVQTWFDKPKSGADPGFGLRLRTAYLNQVNTSLPAWDGFAVLAGFTDVPLFDDARLAGYFDNVDAEQRDKFRLNIFTDETDYDVDMDGVPDSYPGDNPEDFRNRLTTDDQDAPKPYFEYSWPTENMVNLNYRATYQASSDSTMPRFQGMKKESDVLGVIQVNSVPDYINPEKTKFSFGVSADVAALQDFQLDLGNYTGGLDEFLQGTLGVSTDFSMEDILCHTPSGGMEICLYNLEESMLDLTGGDLTSLLGIAVDDVLQAAPLADAIGLVAQGLKQAHQAPAQIKGVLLEPLEDARRAMSSRITNNLAGEFTNLYKNLSAIAVYDPEALQTLSGAPVGDFEAMKIEVAAVRNQLGLVIGQLQAGSTALEQGVGMLVQVDGVIDSLDKVAGQASDALLNLENALDSGLSSLLTTNPSLNPLLSEVEKARQVVTDVRSAIEAVDLGTLGNVLEQAALLSNADIDTSLLDDAQQTIYSSLDELNSAIEQADQAIHDAYSTLPLANMLTEVKQLIDGSNPNNVKGKLNDLRSSLATVKSRILALHTMSHNQLVVLQDQLDALYQLMNSSAGVDGLADWDAAMATSKISFDNIASQFRIVSPGGSLENTLGALPPDIDFITLFNEYLSVLVDAAFVDILEDTGVGGLEDELEKMVLAVTTILPQPSEEDIRNMIRTSLLASPAITELNEVFYSQFGVLSDLLDNISTQLAAHINGIIRQTIDAVNEGLSEQLASSIDPIGGWGSSLQSTGIDGYAIVSQDEFERIHMEAEFVFEGEPDSTSYNAALDVVSLKADNGKSGCIDPGDPNSGNFYDVTISTHDVSADMLGMDVGIKTAMLGFTIDPQPSPVGVFGNCYLDGEINFETLVLEDLGLEAGIGSLETYFGATGAGRFEAYRIPKAAFFVGKSCDFGVLERLDPEVGAFIGEISPLYGAYVRGSVEVPLYNGGCWFTIGLGADIGAWYFTEPSPGTYGGLVGGSAYGRLACLAALKGKVQCIGQKSGSEYKFSGDGWAGAGIGSCSPGSWDSVRDVRHDSWCLTGDATFGATYENGWNISGPDVNCCD